MSAKPLQLSQVPDEINDCVYTSDQYPFLIDPTGQAFQFLKYRSRTLSCFGKGDFEKESLRKALVQCLHNGTWLCLDWGQLDCDIQPLFDKDHFPEAVLNPAELFTEDVYMALLRDSDEFTGKVTYEHQAAAAEGAFQDRTKAHAPERCADVDKSFDPKDGFRLIITTKKEEAPKYLAEKMILYKVGCSEQQVAQGSGVWAGGERPKQMRSKDEQKMDSELLECCFEGEMDEVKKLIDKKADIMAKDGRGHTPLSEAAVQGHLDLVMYLINYNKPIGTDPNAQGFDGRSPLHRAAFQGHEPTVKALLEAGGDPRLKDKNGEKPFDLGSNEETQKALEEWDTEKTDALKEERKKAQDIEDEKLVKTDEDRKRLEKKRKMEKLVELLEAGEKDLLEIELMDIEKRELPGYRDERGNSLLHLAAWKDKVEIAVFLIDELGMNVNLRDAKGWTPVAMAGFHGCKKVCVELMNRKADPLIANSYRKTALDVAKDDEIKDVLKGGGGIGMTPAASSSEAPAAGEGDGADPKAKAKAKGKAKAGGKAKAKAKGK